jgi:hypothetical protein
MAELRERRTIEIKAETIGDVAKWLAHVEDQPTSTHLLDEVTLSVTVDDTARPGPG